MNLAIRGFSIDDPAVQGESARNLRKEILIAMAGPLANAVMAAATAAVMLAVGTTHSLRLTPLVTPGNLAASFFWINACLCAVNLLPAFPLDGGRILRA